MVFLTAAPDPAAHTADRSLSDTLALRVRGEAYIAHWNSNPKPFTWTATADEILAKVDLVQVNIKKLVENNSK